MHKAVLAFLGVGSVVVAACGSSAANDHAATQKQSNAPVDGGVTQASSTNTQTKLGDAGTALAQSDAGRSTKTAEGTAGSSMKPASASDADVMMNTSLSSLPDSFADAICGALLACMGPSALRESTDGEACATRLAAQMRATEFAYMDTAVSNGRVVYDSSALSACLAGIRALECDVLTHAYPQPCSQLLAGKVAEAGECTISAECEGVAYCAGSEQCPSHCAARLGEGDACTGDDQCGDDLMCVSGACLRPSLAGEACNGTSGKVCRIGLSCQGSTDVDTGHCIENAMLLVGDEGAACEPGGSLCKEGLSCVYDGSSAFHCEAAVGSGGKCHLGLPGQCPDGEYCGATDVTAQSNCKALPAAGEACALSAACAPGLACVSESTGKLCRPIADNCGACSADDACRSGRCEQGVCLPPPACGEASACK